MVVAKTSQRADTRTEIRALPKKLALWNSGKTCSPSMGTMLSRWTSTNLNTKQVQHLTISVRCCIVLFMYSSITESEAWDILDQLSPEALCASLPHSVDQSRGFKLTYLGTEDIISPIVFSLPIPGSSDLAYFLTEDCQFYEDLMDYDQVFSDLTTSLDLSSVLV